MARKKRSPEEEVDDNVVVEAPKKRQRRVFPPFSMVTRAGKKFGPATAVLMTTELLENILIRLPMKDLLLAQRVNKKWQAVITDNKDMQRKLFFLPEEDSGFWQLVEVGDVFSGKNVHHAAYDRTTDPDKKAYSVQLNPLLDSSKKGAVYRPWRRPTVNQAVEWTVNAALSDRKHASWRRMYLTQPPALEVIFRILAENGYTSHHDSHCVAATCPCLGTILDNALLKTRQRDEWDAPLTKIQLRVFLYCDTVLPEDQA